MLIINIYLYDEIRTQLLFTHATLTHVYIQSCIYKINTYFNVSTSVMHIVQLWLHKCCFNKMIVSSQLSMFRIAVPELAASHHHLDASGSEPTAEITTFIVELCKGASCTFYLCDSNGCTMAEFLG